MSSYTKSDKCFQAAIKTNLVSNVKIKTDKWVFRIVRVRSSLPGVQITTEMLHKSESRFSSLLDSVLVSLVTAAVRYCNKTIVTSIFFGMISFCSGINRG
jgi:hypothetical protein